MNYYYELLYRRKLITFHLRVEQLKKNLKFELDIVKDMETNIAGNIN